MISFYNVTKTYSPDIIALENVSFQVQKNEFVSIVGRSGAGKTTLLKLLLGEEKPTQGQIFFDEFRVQELSSSELSGLRRKVGTVFQDYRLLSSKTTYENIAYVLEVVGRSPGEIENSVSEVLDLVELKDRSHSFPAELSGGECQRAAIARALVHRPQVILADEPTGNLDPYHTHDIIRLLLKINEMGTTVILATHHKEIINSLEKRVITLEDGKIIRDDEKGRFII